MCWLSWDEDSPWACGPPFMCWPSSWLERCCSSPSSSVRSSSSSTAIVVLASATSPAGRQRPRSIKISSVLKVHAASFADDRLAQQTEKGGPKAARSPPRNADWPPRCSSRRGRSAFRPMMRSPPSGDQSDARARCGLASANVTPAQTICFGSNGLVNPALGEMSVHRQRFALSLQLNFVVELDAQPPRPTRILMN